MSLLGKQQPRVGLGGAIRVGPRLAVMVGSCFSSVKETKSLSFGLFRQNRTLGRELLDRETGEGVQNSTEAGNCPSLGSCGTDRGTVSMWLHVEYYIAVKICCALLQHATVCTNPGTVKSR